MNGWVEPVLRSDWIGSEKDIIKWALVGRRLCIARMKSHLWLCYWLSNRAAKTGVVWIVCSRRTWWPLCWWSAHVDTRLCNHWWRCFGSSDWSDCRAKWLRFRSAGIPSPLLTSIYRPHGNWWLHSLPAIPGLRGCICSDTWFRRQWDQLFVSAKWRPMRRTWGWKWCLRTSCRDICNRIAFISGDPMLVEAHSMGNQSLHSCLTRGTSVGHKKRNWTKLLLPLQPIGISVIQSARLTRRATKIRSYSSRHLSITGSDPDWSHDIEWQCLFTFTCLGTVF